ncbi:MAG: hypothetical protein ACYTE8_09055 [Planctomycetota bacterium]|jgi:hypothetical protein
MKKEYAIQDLKEAREHLDEIIEILEKSHNLEPLTNEYLLAYFNEVYWHINRVWNCRNTPQKVIDDAQDDDWDKLCQFPKDVDV